MRPATDIRWLFMEEADMDPVTAATTAVAVLAPYLKKGGEKLAEKVMGEKLTEGASKLWHAIRDKFKGKPAALEAARDFAANPTDEDNQAAFRKELRKAQEGDAHFAAEAKRLLIEAGASADRVTNVGSGAVATHGGVAAGEGGVAVKGDVHGDISVNQPSKKK